MDTKRNQAENQAPNQAETILDEIVLSNLNRCAIAKTLFMRKVSYDLDSEKITITSNQVCNFSQEAVRAAEGAIDTHCKNCNLMGLHQPVAEATPVGDKSGAFNPSISIL
jgi:hypothetical protein